MNEENQVIGWGDSFQAEESSFKLLPAGEYDFVVIGFERKIYDGNSSKIQNGTPYAEITVKIYGAEGETEVTDRLYMMVKWQWKLTQFFAGIGQAPVIGQAFSPNWNAVVGSRGKAKVSINEYTKRDGSQGKNNQIDEYLPGGQSQGTPTYNAPQQPYTPPTPQSNYQAPVQTPPAQPYQPTNGGFQPGAF